MVDFLTKTLSKQRWETYEKLSTESLLDAQELYRRNLIYSKELYIILSGLEVVIRNSFHDRLQKNFKREDWFSLDLEQNFFGFMHKRQLKKAIADLTKNKKGAYIIDDVVAELNFGFWAHLTNAPYEQKFWISSLRHCFPNKFGKPVRQDVENRLKQLLKMRNKIAHLEPIIKNENQLIQVYQNAYDLLSWICPKTADWFDNMSDFRDVWNQYNKKEL